VKRTAPVLVWSVAAVVGAGCVHMRTYVVGRRVGSDDFALVTARAASGEVAVVGATGPDSDATATCSSLSYRIGNDATHLHMWPGTYRIDASVSRTEGRPKFFITGRITVEPGKCYVPAMTCDGLVRDAATCRLAVTATECESRASRNKIYPASSEVCRS
jgi:hypothetical protein